MIINILAGGPEKLLPDLSLYHREGEVWIGVDRGVFTLMSRDIPAQYAFGDFDSVTDEQMQKIEQKISQLKKFQPEKDETDMELALNWALAQKPDLIRLFGATGGRLDHLFANIQLMLKPILNGLKTDIVMIDYKNEIYLKGPGIYEIKKAADKKYVSFVPVLTAVTDLTLTGFKYPLNNQYVPIASTLCISNELLDKNGTFSFSEGILMVIKSND